MSSGSLTVFTATVPAHLGKVYSLGANGELLKDTAGDLVEGTYEMRNFDSAHGLSSLVTTIGTHQAITASLPLDGRESGSITTRKRKQAGRPGLTRTKECFGHPVGQRGVLSLDYDEHGEALSREELWQRLLRVAPMFAAAGVVWWCSGSSHVHEGERELQGLRGQRLYVLITDLSDTVRAGKVLAQRLWLANHGHVEVSKAGSCLVRSTFDEAMHQAARLDFIGGSVVAAPLSQRRGQPVVLSDGDWLDTRAALPDLTDEELVRYEALVEKAKDAKRDQVTAARAAHRSSQIGLRVPALMAQGVTAADAEQRIGAVVDSAFGGVLLGEFMLTVVRDDGTREQATVAQVLDQRERFNEEDCLDPLNPGHRGGSPDARLYLDSASPVVYSLDGNVVYRLRRQAERICTAKGARGELVEAVVRVLVEQDDVFMTDAGPVQVVGGRVIALTAQRVQNLIGSRVALFGRGANGRDIPTDLTREAADLALAALC